MITGIQSWCHQDFLNVALLCKIRSTFGLQSQEKDKSYDINSRSRFQISLRVDGSHIHTALYLLRYKDFLWVFLFTIHLEATLELQVLGQHWQMAHAADPKQQAAVLPSEMMAPIKKLFKSSEIMSPFLFYISILQYKKKLDIKILSVKFKNSYFVSGQTTSHEDRFLSKLPLSAKFNEFT